MKKVIALCALLTMLTGCTVVSPDEVVSKEEYEQLQDEYEKLQDEHDALEKERESIEKKYESSQEKLSEAQDEIKRLNIVTALDSSVVHYVGASFDIPTGFKPIGYHAFEKGSTSILMGAQARTDRSITLKEFMDTLVEKELFEDISSKSIKYFESNIGTAALVSTYNSEKETYHTICTIMSDQLYAIIVSGKTEQDCKVMDDLLENLRPNGN